MRRNRKGRKIRCLLLYIAVAAVLFAGCGKKESAEMISCTISISCETILSNMDRLKEGKEKYVPEDGWILTERTMELEAGSSVFDLLQTACREHEIQMEFSESPVYKSAYIEGIHQIYEMDCGSSSGWMYRVNGEYPNYGSSKYELAPGDLVEFVYTCNLGADVGKEMEE